MAQPDYEPGVTLSLLDRLTDAPAPQSSWEAMRELKASIGRDLTALLNTRRAEHDFDPSYDQAANSVLTFGVADFTSYNLKNGIEQERVRRSIERAIRRFEPRLTAVTVTMDEPDPVRPVLSFQINAMLRVEPAAEPVAFDVTLRRDSRRMHVAGAAA
jgi:type VI secretion system protein ImpF